MPAAIKITTQAGRETRDVFKVASNHSLNKAPTDGISDISQDNVPRVMRRLINERFPDATFSLASDEITRDWMDCHITWRGGLRRRRIFWRSENGDPAAQRPTVSHSIDWEIFNDVH